MVNMFILNLNGGGKVTVRWGPIYPVLLRVKIDVAVQDCSISIANAQEIPLSCTKPSNYVWFYV